MSWLTRTFTSSVGKKFLIALTGVGLFGFVVIHLSGNLLLFLGLQKFNAYSKMLHDNFLLPLAEVGLVGAFVLHIYLVLTMAYSNKKARGPQGYQTGLQSKQEKTPGVQWAAIASKTTVIGGLIVLAFLLVHIWDFRLQRVEGDYNMAQKVIKALQDPFRATLYSLGSLAVGWHLFHGIQSSARSLGLRHPRYIGFIQKFGILASILVGVLFASIPIAIFVGFVK